MYPSRLDSERFRSGFSFSDHNFKAGWEIIFREPPLIDGWRVGCNGTTRWPWLLVHVSSQWFDFHLRMKKLNMSAACLWWQLILLTPRRGQYFREQCYAIFWFTLYRISLSRVSVYVPFDVLDVHVGLQNACSLEKTQPSCSFACRVAQCWGLSRRPSVWTGTYRCVVDFD